MTLAGSYSTHNTSTHIHARITHIIHVCTHIYIYIHMQYMNNSKPHKRVQRTVFRVLGPVDIYLLNRFCSSLSPASCFYLGHVRKCPSIRISAQRGRGEDNQLTKRRKGLKISSSSRCAYTTDAAGLADWVQFCCQIKSN